jgi:hypothetical protein
MPLTLAEHFALIEAEYAAALAAPLSARQAMLVAVLLDKYPDRVFAAHRADPVRVHGAEDLPAYRAVLRQRTPALATIFALCACRPDGPRLETRAVDVPLSDYPNLPLEDFMVSLYNNHTVQRVLLVGAAGAVRLAHKVLAEALEACRGL